MSTSHGAHVWFNIAPGLRGVCLCVGRSWLKCVGVPALLADLCVGLHLEPREAHGRVWFCGHESVCGLHLEQREAHGRVCLCGHESVKPHTQGITPIGVRTRLADLCCGLHLEPREAHGRVCFCGHESANVAKRTKTVNNRQQPFLNTV